MTPHTLHPPSPCSRSARRSSTWHGVGAAGSATRPSLPAGWPPLRAQSLRRFRCCGVSHSRWHRGSAACTDEAVAEWLTVECASKSYQLRPTSRFRSEAHYTYQAHNGICAAPPSASFDGIRLKFIEKLDATGLNYVSNILEASSRSFLTRVKTISASESTAICHVRDLRRAPRRRNASIAIWFLLSMATSTARSSKR